MDLQGQKYHIITHMIIYHRYKAKCTLYKIIVSLHRAYLDRKDILDFLEKKEELYDSIIGLIICIFSTFQSTLD